MADLTKILGGPWTPPPEPAYAPPEVQFREAILKAGVSPPDEIILDGQLRRFRTDPKKHDRSGWYVGHADGVCTMIWGDWRMGIEQTVKADTGRKLTVADEMAHVARVAAAKAARDAERKKQNEAAASTVEIIWSEGAAASPEHPYFKRKGIQPHGAKITGDGRLMVPLFDADGALSSLQYIDADGGKLYHPGGSVGGKFCLIGTLDVPGVLYVAEGFATAATIHEVSNRPVIVAYSASNLVPVTGTLRDLYGQAQDIVIVADNDASGVGQKYAEQACAKYGARMVMPSVQGDANDYAQAGHDLAGLLNPPKNQWLINADDFCAQPAPISWLVKRWVQAQALVMVHGPSGGGKTFVVLDWCLRMANGGGEWASHKTKPGVVVYLAGEGHHGLRSRVAAWKHHHQAGSLSMWLSKDGCDLNTPDGYLRVSENLRQLPAMPQLIVVDTLHRFLAGDENSAQDAKTMLDACNGLMREFNCTVILVHHTGVSDEAQHRARGSSAWRGALDIEISIVPAKDGAPMEIVQRKSKDAELAETIYCQLQSVDIPGWFDEEGEAVSSAIVEVVGAPEKKAANPVEKHKKLFENAWWGTGAEMREGSPYISRSAMTEYLINTLGVSPSSAAVYIKPSQKGRVISELILAEIIKAHEHGWIVIEPIMASAMSIRRNEGA
jgi:putative DNA primase/helicase